MEKPSVSNAGRNGKNDVKKEGKTKKEGWVKYLVAAVLCVLIAGAYFYVRPKSALQLIVPDLDKINKLEINLKNDTAYIVLHCLLKNKAPYKMHIDSLHYTIRLDTATIVVEKQNLNLIQQSGQEDTVLLHARLAVKTIRKTIKSLWQQDSTTITGDFKIYYDNIFGKTELPFTKKWEIRVPSPPKIKLVKISRQNVKLFKKEALVNAQIQVINKSHNLELDLSQLTYQVSIGNDITGNGSTAQVVKIKPQSTITVTLPVLLKVDKPLKTSLEVLFDNDKVDYTIHLQGILNTKKMTGIPVELTTSGETELVK